MSKAREVLQNNVLSLSCIKVAVLLQSLNRRDLGCHTRRNIYRVRLRIRRLVRTYVHILIHQSGEVHRKKIWSIIQVITLVLS